MHLDLINPLDDLYTRMNNTPNTSNGMGHETPMAQSNNYSQDNWNAVSPYSQSPYENSPMNDYGFGNYVHHGLPSESLTRMPPPPPQPPSHHMMQTTPPLGHHQLPMLNTTWPSMLTNPTPSSFSAPPLSMPPLSSVVKKADAPRPPAAAADKARKTLSTEQKRAMCQYHEDNPGMRQADIGAKFGVERSTVSKVLRHKEQYLKRDQPLDQASLKRSKGKYPDFDRTLSNFVRRQQQKGGAGTVIRDEDIMDQAKKFARASGNEKAILSTLTSSWLQKFKQKHGIKEGRLMRRASEANIPDSARLSTARSGHKVQLSDVILPSSPTGQISPMSAGHSDQDDGVVSGGSLNFGGYKNSHSQSTTSLASTDVRDTGPSPFPGGTVSPAGPFNFSPDPNTGGFAPMDHIPHSRPGSADFQHREKRSNTFPSLNIEYGSRITTDTIMPSSMTPRNPASTAPSSALESPANEIQSLGFAIDSLTSSPKLRRSGSNSSITTTGGRQGATTPIVTSAVPASLDSSPVSPSQEEARRAANTLLTYIQSVVHNGQFDQGEYNTVVQLTKKLQIHPHVAGPRASIGGLSRIPEGDSEMNATAEIRIDSK